MTKKKTHITQILFVLLVLFFSSVCSANPEQDFDRGKSHQIDSTLGVYIISIHDIDLKQHTFEVAFWAWWLSSDPEYKPFDTTEISNARQFTVTSQYSEPLQGKVRSEAKIMGKINNNWDATHFPFDRQELKIILEDANLPMSALRFTPDQKNSGVAPSLDLFGWEIVDFKILPSVSWDETNFGDPTRSGRTGYSNATVLIEIQRKGISLFINYFIGLFITALLCSIMYWSGLDEIETRIGLLLGAIFALIGNKYILDSTLPASHYVTLSDKLQLLTFAMVIFAVVSNTVTHKLVHANRRKAAWSINAYVGYSTSILYLLFLIFFAYQSYTAA